MRKLTVFICLFLCLALSVTASALTVVEEDLDQAGAGDELASIDNMYGFFEWNNATNDSYCELVNDNGGTALKIAGASELFTLDYIPAEYVFSVDIKPLKDNGMVNIFVRGDMPGALVKLNPKNAGTMQSFPYYEWDWYAENGGAGGSGVGGSGAAVSLTGSGFSLKLKKYAKDGLTVASKNFNVKTGTVDLNAYNNVKITDTGKQISIYLNGELGAYIVLSDESVRYESDGTNIDYYKSAEVFSADGKSLGTVEDTRLHYKGSQLAVAGRFETFYVDNIIMVTGEHAIEYSNGEYTPETSADTEPSTVTDAPGTEPGTTGAEDTVTDGQTTGEETRQSAPAGKSKKGTVILIAAIADVVIIAALAVFIPKKKK